MDFGGWEVLTKNLGPIRHYLVNYGRHRFRSRDCHCPARFLYSSFPLGIRTRRQHQQPELFLHAMARSFICIICVYTPIAWFANEIVMTYLQSVWTLTYIRITKPKQEEQAPIISPTNA